MFSDELYNDRALCCVSACYQCTALPLTLWGLLGFKDLNISAWHWMPIIAALRRLRQEECDCSQPGFLLKRGWEGGESKTCSRCLRWSSWGGASSELMIVATLAGMKWCVDHYSPHQRKNLAVVWERRELDSSGGYTWSGWGATATGLYRLDFSVLQPMSAQETASLSRYNKTCSLVARLQQIGSSLVSSVSSCPESSLLKSPWWSLWKATL